jgi:hypothetical protein
MHPQSSLPLTDRALGHVLTPRAKKKEVLQFEKNDSYPGFASAIPYWKSEDKRLQAAVCGGSR